MDLPVSFSPSRQRGLIFHASAILFLGSSGGFCLYTSIQQQIPVNFIVWMFLAILLLSPVAFLIYRGFGLLQAHYTLERDGIRLSWGLRIEDIPLPDIEWIRPADEMGFTLPLPPLTMPGALLGSRTIDGIGKVEFLASSQDNLLLIATRTKIFAISPSDEKGFLRTFQYSIELGSLSPITPYSARPAAYLKQVWGDRFAKICWLSASGLTLLLFFLVSFLAANHTLLPLGYEGNGLQRMPGPSEHLFLLPVLSAITLTTDVMLGMYFYRQNETKIIARLVWASSVLLSALFTIAVFLI